MERADNKAMRLGVKTFWALKTLRFSREERKGGGVENGMNDIWKEGGREGKK